MCGPYVRWTPFVSKKFQPRRRVLTPGDGGNSAPGANTRGLADSLQLDIGNGRVRLGDRLAVFPQSFKVQLNRFPDIALDFFHGPAGRDTSGEIRDVGGKIVCTMLDNDRVLFHTLPLSPA